MASLSIDRWPSLVLLGGLLLVVVVFLSACSDDPILGPDQDLPEEEGGGSYSSIKRLAPADTGRSSPAAPIPDNPERF